MRTIAQQRRGHKKPRDLPPFNPEPAYDRSRGRWWVKLYQGHVLPASEPGFGSVAECREGIQEIRALRREKDKFDEMNRYADRKRTGGVLGRQPTTRDKLAALQKEYDLEL